LKILFSLLTIKEKAKAGIIIMIMPILLAAFIQRETFISFTLREHELTE